MTASRRIDFENLKNTRDLGGILTKDGSRIRQGRLIRSGHLYEASAKDLAKLSDSLDMIIDFRTDQEESEKPDPLVSDVPNLHMPIFNSLKAGVTREEESDEAAINLLIQDPRKAMAYMCRTYEGFVADAFCVSQYEKFVRFLLEDHPKAVLWHCTAGKDRAGFASVIIEEILGVEREIIKADYLKTNEYLAPEVKQLIAMVKRLTGASGKEADQGLAYLFGACPEYLDAVYKKADELFGSFKGFIRNGLNITEEEQEKLRQMYLERRV